MLLLLPERRRFAGQAPSRAAARWLGRADRLGPGEPGERAQLLRHFELLPRGWPMAAITRQADAGDAGQRAWLRADPVFVRAEATGARLHSWGSLALEREEADAFLAALRPVFGEAGMQLDAPVPERWYLGLAPGAPLPAFTEPAEALGGDLLALLPQGPEGRRWRALFNEAQVILHQHPRNAMRAAAGRDPVNALWFWGAGRLPDAVRTSVGAVLSRDVELLALARLSGVPTSAQDDASGLVDLRHSREWSKVERVVDDALRGDIAVELDFADGARWQLRAAQRWRFWRRARTRLED